MKTKTSQSISLSILVSLFILACTNTSYAKDYKIEAIIFENLNADYSTENSHYQPPEPMSSNTNSWTIDPHMLADAKKSIDLSPNYTSLKYLAWGQSVLPINRSPAIELAEENIHGWIKVYAGQLLFANIDLEINGYRMNEKRRIKLNEKHYFDHPKFGVLLQVSRLELATVDK